MLSFLLIKVLEVLVPLLTFVGLILVKQIAVPPGTAVSTASFSDSIPQPTTVASSPGLKDQIEDEEKKMREKVEKKGTFFLAMIGS